jgi:hypothetical protein
MFEDSEDEEILSKIEESAKKQQQKQTGEEVQAEAADVDQLPVCAEYSSLN